MGIWEHYCDKGWAQLHWARDVADWAAAVRPAAQRAAEAPENARWLRHGGTWFAGVNVLPNTQDGAVAGAGPLPKSLRKAVADLNLEYSGLDRGQVSVVYPGYPRQDPDESDSGHLFRLRRDAAHVDGLLPVGPNRRRKLQEPHSFVLGVPLTETEASPMVVWEGSHRVIQAALHDALSGHPIPEWSNVDLTEAYQTARRLCFATCARVPVTASPGEAYIVHRHALHGVAPWREGPSAPPEGRMIVYFRPELPLGLNAWIET